MNWDVIGQLLGDGLLAAVAAIGFAVISNPPRKAIFISALLAAVGHALRFYLIRYTPLDIAMASLVAAFTIGMFSMLFAKLIHCPAVHDDPTAQNQTEAPAARLQTINPALKSGI